MIANEKDSLKRLKDELYALEKCSQGKIKTMPAIFEEIGNGLHRLHIAGLLNSDIDLGTVNKFFVNTANSVSGSIEGFEEKLEALKECCRDNSLPYSLEELETYLTGYKNQGYPPVSHSETYRVLYSPAYRIVKEEYRHYYELFNRIDSLMKSKNTVKVAIDGNSGAGKSTLSHLIGNVYDCNIFHMDDFFLRPELKIDERLSEIGGNVDYVRFREEVIAGLNSGREFRYQIYNCKIMALEQYISVTPKKLNIIEGVYSMHPTLVDNYDLKIFLHVDAKEQSQRILRRNGELMHNRFIHEWIPLEDEYFTNMKIKEQSHLVFVG